MHGIGQATAAITIVNALPTGIGAAVGINLRTRVEVTLSASSGASRAEPTFRPASSATPLVVSSLAHATERFAPEGWDAAVVSVQSEIPFAAGLKSSSAVSSAIVLAVARASGVSLPPAEVARASAEIGRATRVSATGAFDDALAGLVDGVVVTDNHRDQLIRSFPLDPDLSVALWVPPGTHPNATAARPRFPGDSPRTRAPVEAAQDGRLWEAMELNSEIVEEAMGYPYGDVRRRLRTLGALGSGTSGLGPAFAAVAPRALVPELIAEFTLSPGRTFPVDFSPPRRAEAGS
jgi:shikimate kinase